MSQIASILVSDITVSSRLRSASDDKVAAMAGSMDELGLQTPIDVYCDEGGNLALVVGLHRLLAAKKLGWKEIQARVLTLDHVDRQLWEIDENLMRAELSLMERADHHAKRKRLLEARGAVQVHGGDRKSSQQDAGLKSYAAEAAEKLGSHPETIRRDVRRSEGIAEDVKATLAHLPRQPTGADLDALARVEPERQREAVAAVDSGHAQSIREVFGEIVGSKSRPGEKTTNQHFRTLTDVWGAADNAARDLFIKYLQEQDTYRAAASTIRRNELNDAVDVDYSEVAQQ